MSPYNGHFLDYYFPVHLHRWCSKPMHHCTNFKSQSGIIHSCLTLRIRRSYLHLSLLTWRSFFNLLHNYGLKEVLYINSRDTSPDRDASAHVNRAVPKFAWYVHVCFPRPE
jgi:hypothetical protein